MLCPELELVNDIEYTYSQFSDSCKLSVVFVEEPRHRGHAFPPNAMKKTYYYSVRVKMIFVSMFSTSSFHKCK